MFISHNTRSIRRSRVPRDCISLSSQPPGLRQPFGLILERVASATAGREVSSTRDRAALVLIDQPTKPLATQDRTDGRDHRILTSTIALVLSSGAFIDSVGLRVRKLAGMVRHRNWLAAGIATFGMAGLLGIPIAWFFYVHPPPTGTANEMMVAIPNVILLVGVWMGLFFVARAMLTKR